MADPFAEYGEKEVISFKVHKGGIIAKEIPSMILSRAQERADVSNSIKAAAKAERSMEECKKLIKTHDLFEFLKQQRFILYNIRDAIQEDYYAKFINNILRKRMIEKLEDFLKKNPSDEKAKKEFNKFMESFKNILLKERTYLHNLEAAAGGNPSGILKVEEKFAIKNVQSGILKTIKLWKEKRLVSKTFRVETQLERIEKKGKMDTKTFIALLNRLKKFNALSTAISKDLSIMIFYLLQKEIEYEKALEKGIEDIELPKATKKIIDFHKNLREKAKHVFADEVEMLNQLGGLEREAQKVLQKTSA